MRKQTNLAAAGLSSSEALHATSLEEDISFLPMVTFYAQLQSSEKGLPETIARRRVADQKQSSRHESRFKRELSLFLLHT